MNTKLYVGNLPYDVTEPQLQEYFATQGGVAHVNVVTDRETGQARGFAFVEMEDVDGMKSAISELDGKEFEGRPLKVNEAKPRENRGGGGGGNYRGGNKDNRVNSLVTLI